MNFNHTQSPDYQLNTTLAEEMINLYGVPTKFLVAERINRDDNVFGDYSHLKTDNSKIYDIYMLPENSEEWDQGGYNLTSFGLVNFENVSLFVAKSSFDGIIELPQITGNLIVFPNNKVMEITETDPVVPGVNNLFTHNDAKSIFKLTCKPYDFKLINEIDNTDMSVQVDPETGEAVQYETLDHYFDELIGEKAEQDDEAEIIPQVTTVDQSSIVHEKVVKPIIDNSEDSVWGQFE